MDPYFSELGRGVYAYWKKENFSPAAFPAIALKALEKSPPSAHVDLHEFIRKFLLEDEQPFQTSSGFGQPELIVHDNPMFYIQLLFWMDGTTDIHQHGFSGAFHVMTGSSIHTEFEFKNAHPVTARFRTGDLCLKSTRLLETGSTVPIHSGSGCIHSLFHLETPSVTVVIRTHSDPGTDPQFTYLPPHIAVDPAHQDSLTMRRKQLLDVLEGTEHPAYAKLVRQMIVELDFERGFFILQNCVRHLQSLGAWENTWSAYVKKHGRMALRVKPTLEEIIRRDGMVAMRATIEDVEHRFFLALLLNVTQRRDLFAMVAKRYPGDARKTILRWMEELLVSDGIGISLLDFVFPDALGVSPEEQPMVFLTSLKYLLKGGKPMAREKVLSGQKLALFKNTLQHSSLGILLNP